MSRISSFVNAESLDPIHQARQKYSTIKSINSAVDVALDDDRVFNRLMSDLAGHIVEHDEEPERWDGLE